MICEVNFGHAYARDNARTGGSGRARHTEQPPAAMSMFRAVNLFRSHAAIARSAMRTTPNVAVQKRFLSIHEYLSVNLLNKFGIDTPKSLPAATAEEAFEAAKSFGGKPVVIKAQVLAGGRGKGHFDNGLQGGVHLIKTCLLYTSPSPRDS